MRNKILNEGQNGDWLKGVRGRSRFKVGEGKGAGNMRGLNVEEVTVVLQVREAKKFLGMQELNIQQGDEEGFQVPGSFGEGDEVRAENPHLYAADQNTLLESPKAVLEKGGGGRRVCEAWSTSKQMELDKRGTNKTSYLLSETSELIDIPMHNREAKTPLPNITNMENIPGSAGKEQGVGNRSGRYTKQENGEKLEQHLGLQLVLEELKGHGILGMRRRKRV